MDREGRMSLITHTAARRTARKSSFYRAMAILPTAQRDAMFEIYSFCRAVDDIADGEGARDEKTAALDLWRRDIRALYDGGHAGLAEGLIGPLRDFSFEQDDFHAVIDGMQMDVDEQIVAPDAQKLDLYCDRVASAVGRLSVRVFGLPEQEGVDLAYNLGRALQLTNILRDIDEDAGLGRLYLPRELLEGAGFADPSPELIAARADLDPVCRPLMAQAQGHFDKAAALMASRPRAEIRAPMIMYLAYRAIWRRLDQRGFKAPREKIATPKLAVLGAFLRYGMF
jgi:phytoene synthase